ncbi:MAG: hypothetical protein FWG02_06615 [Holophagaceae bacterium]|nr:hypothetical protein [Holophagaceae bacterium]
MEALKTLESRGHWGIKKGLENISRLLAGLGHPESNFPAILIAGTNGKGSTGAFLAHALRSAGLLVGWTTSPHLLSPAERIWIDGRHISEIDLNSYLTKVLKVESELGIVATYFELMIASAILAFKEVSIDIALVEVGLGGRWDSTNVLDPIATILTNVALDHTAHLGEDVNAIAIEKLCTARDGRPLILGPRLDPKWIASLCEYKPEIVESNVPMAEIHWDHSVVNGHHITLAGRHQIDNLATAITTIHVLTRLGWTLDMAKVYRGFSQAGWPGRFWKVPGLSNIFFDGAHNESGARALADHICKFGISPHLFFCAMGDKDLKGVVRQLATINPLSVTLIQAEGTRFATPQDMQTAWLEVGYGNLPVLTIKDAATKLKKNLTDTFVVTGSLYFLGQMLKELDISVL